MLKISVTIIAGSEEDNIRECLESVRWADEIIVVNSYSKDRTAEIAREFTDRVFLHEWQGYAIQKQFALDQATSEWVLSLDADERVTPELRNEIQEIIHNGSAFDGFRIPRRNYFLGKWIKHCGWYPGYQLRLFRREKTKMNHRLVHEGFDVNGSIGILHSDIIHYTHPTIHSTLGKINEYSSLQAIEKSPRKKITTAGLIIHPFVAFFQMLILRGGILDGPHGIMVSMIHAITNALTTMKIWELQHKKDGKEEDQ